MVAGFDKEGTAVLQLAYAVGSGLAGFFGNKCAVFVVVDVALPRLEFEETACDDGFAVGGGEKGVAQTYDASAGDGEVELDAVALGLDGAHFAFATGDYIDDFRREFFRHQYGQLFDRLTFLAVDFFDDDFGLSDLQFVAFAPHGLDEDGEMQYAAAVDEERVGRAGLFDAHGQVFFEFVVEALANVAAGDIFAFLAEERRVVDGEKHRHCGLVDLDGRQGFGIVVVADGVADFEHHVLVEVEEHGTDFAGFDNVLGSFFAQAFEGVELLDFGMDNLGFFVFVSVFVVKVRPFGECYSLSGLECSAIETTDGYASEVGAVVERREHHLGVAFRNFRCGYVLDDEVHQIADVFGGGVPVGTHPSLFGAAVCCREVELVVVGTEVEHEVEDSLLSGLGVAVGFVDFVDDDYGLQTQFDGFLQNKTRLWHRTFKGVYDEQHTVGHVQDAFHFTAEVAMARGVYDVDFVVAVADTHVFRKDGDAAFTFEVVVVENKVASFLVVAKKFGLMQHSVDKGGFAVVDMCYNCHIANILH